MYTFIIHPCDPTVVICYLIRPCDIAVWFTYLISHSYSLTYNSRIFQFGCIINTKQPSCDDIIHRTSLGFHSWCSESTKHQLWKPHDVRRIISTHSGGFVYISDEQTCLITTSYHVPDLRYSTQARKYKPLLHCTGSLKRNDIETFCL